ANPHFAFHSDTPPPRHPDTPLSDAPLFPSHPPPKALTLAGMAQAVSEELPSTVSPSATPAPAGRPRGDRILVVEDDADLGGLLCDLLATEGYDPVRVDDGAEAVRRVAADPPDAVVLDVMLPGLDGFEVCQRLKFRRETNAIPILMLTALDDAKARRTGLRVGADRYLTKPFEPDELLREIRETLEHSRQAAAGGVHTAIQFQMHSDGRLREQLNDMLSELFVQTPLSEEDVGRIRYAVLEMVQNAVEWGNRNRQDLEVSVSYEVTRDAVKFVVTDQGEGFNPTHVPHAANEDDPVAHMGIREKLGLRDGGFGILISKGMVDEFKYNDAGNQVTLVKHFGGRKPG
ncbi:MAG: response regulator with CheY-like receiver domain and winged-helix DNA-binding domain, partial [Phycisphaerales bacterium]|nr:response regulator with CheY-like receiver domain and winged-helix DNA-binding domain [Phycisphaerales bacterium]